ncbi:MULTISPECIES: D-amino acid dehydrogenase [unclassified Sphingomonas]|uniref:D-amino acid dehydrogenase n=1 Tax=unclassified Sphingomonas TaxID=196159 RepID=UPI0021516BFD|nr:MULTISPECIES: D-amino acid dehydrogenase [unclassified Sphingomonas]MCR5869557.1 D-amino acid dehydrogenase [Sphingomonas sp. J344]UUX98727.1 D-amino acid dehydrogenase [Sphingomonas sp. J315]
MKAVILGAGVIGITSAHYLRRAGHEVVVIDRQPGAALETSFANAGEVSPGYASPWAAPGIPMKAIRWLMLRHAPLIVRPAADLAMVTWLAAMLRNCTEARYALNKSRMVRLAEFSRDELIHIRASLGIAYDERSRGTLQLFRTAKQLDASGKDIEVLRSYGVPFELLDRQGCVAAEPGLAAARDRIAGGLRLPNDETGDCHLFTARLAERLSSAGVEFSYSTEILGLEEEHGSISGVQTSKGVIRGDAYLLALGSHSPLLARQVGVRLPIYPVKGYSITLRVADMDSAPVSTLLDETYKIAITRLGKRIRVGGMAEISGYDRSLPSRREATLLHCVHDLFPTAAQDGPTNFWSGLRPMTPDGPPIIGRTRLSNLFLNTGHGTLGWTMACGSVSVAAAVMTGERPAIDIAGLGLDRYSN